MRLSEFIHYNTNNGYKVTVGSLPRPESAIAIHLYDKVPRVKVWIADESMNKHMADQNDTYVMEGDVYLMERMPGGM